MKVRAKGAAASSARNASVKNRVGTRKAGKAAHQMSTADLIEALDRDTNSRAKSKIMKVLKIRNVDLTPKVEEVAEEVTSEE